MLMDTSVVSQTYIEDCEVCCNPIEIKVVFDNFELISLSAKNIKG